jgi:hypothetical protein
MTQGEILFINLLPEISKGPAPEFQFDSSQYKEFSGYGFHISG